MGSHIQLKKNFHAHLHLSHFILRNLVNLSHCFNFHHHRHRNHNGNAVDKKEIIELRGKGADEEFHYCDVVNITRKSRILREKDAIPLFEHLPPRAIGYEWELVYATWKHGASLASMYRALGKMDHPILMFIEDLEGRMFGVYMSCGWRICDNFYGDCSTFVFKGNPEPFRAFKWSSKNFYFLQGKDDFVSVGSGSGKCALWLDDNLDKGRSEECDTFGSPPLTPNKDFHVKLLECWTIKVN